MSIKEPGLLLIKNHAGKFLVYDLDDGNPYVAGSLMISEMQKNEPIIPPSSAKFRSELNGTDSWFLERETSALWLYYYDPSEKIFEAYRMSNWFKDSLYVNDVKRMSNFMIRFFHGDPQNRNTYEQSQIEFSQGEKMSAKLMQFWINERINFLKRTEINNHSNHAKQ